MHVAGSRSWRFENNDLDTLPHAVFVRDAATLPVPASADVPPPLVGDVAAASTGLSAAALGLAVAQWLSWWHQLLDRAVREVAIRRAEDPGQDPLTRLVARVSGRTEVFDTPDFHCLSQMPELQAAALATQSAYRARSASDARGTKPEGFPWLVVNDAVHDAAASLGVPVAEMDAVAHVLDVDGRWSMIAGPRCGVCSLATAVDPDSAWKFLRELFISGSAAGVGRS